MVNVNKHFRRCLLLVLAFLIIDIIAYNIVIITHAGSIRPGVPLKDKFPLEENENEYNINFDYDINGILRYGDYIAKYAYANKDLSNKPIELIYTVDIINSRENTPLTVENYKGYKSKALMWEKREAYFEWAVEVPMDALYQIEFDYYIPSGYGGHSIRSISIDGVVPFQEAQHIKFEKYWKNGEYTHLNSGGHQVHPPQVEVEEWRRAAIQDSAGMYEYPFSFYLTKGKHFIRITYIDQPLVLGNMYLVIPEDVKPYNELYEEYLNNGYKNTDSEFVFQAEDNVILKNDPTLRMESSSDPACEPMSAGKRTFNNIGGYRWRKGQQSITWEFYVPSTGLYKIGLHVLQAWDDGLPAYRQIRIDGKVPFSELAAYKFKFNNDWYIETLCNDDGEPYLFYLAEGTHVLTMMVKQGEYREIIHGIMDDALLLSDLNRKIVMITGSNPDVNYDYELQKVIPDLRENMNKLISRIDEKTNALINITGGKRTPIVNNFINMKTQLQNMVQNPFIIPRKLGELNSMQTMLGSWYLDLQEQPLAVDWISGAPVDANFKEKRFKFFIKLWITFKNFLSSFTANYNSIGIAEAREQINDNEDVVLKVWVGLGREWAEIIKEMADEQFTPQTNIRLDINVVPSSQLNAGKANALMLAIISGRAPDIALGIDSVSPVEFAIREAVIDLSSFEDYQDIEKRFISKIMESYKYKGGIYALPETVDFNVMFYRKDIIKELGIKLPETWDELINYTLPVLYQNGMQFYYPAPSASVAQSKNPFDTFLFQHGGEYYNDDHTRSTLDSPQAYQAFQKYTGLYSNYGVPVAADFFNRMRRGEMPLGIGNYADYMKFSVAAPELAGKWSITLVPGTKREDGSVDHSIGSIMGNADIILSQTKYPEEAWEFLKWWSTADTQVGFAREIEALVGVEARWNTANKEAFKQLPWDLEHLSVIEKEWEWARATPIVLGGYFTPRHIMNAWTGVVLGDELVRDSLEKAVKDINREITMKREEYGLLDAGSDKE